MLLDNALVRQILEEPNSSKYAMDAHHRNITEIECLDEVLELKTLDVSFNVLNKLKNLNKLKQLKELKAYSNRIEDIDGLDKNLKLEVVYLGGNKLKGISKSLMMLRCLKVLRLENNCIRKVDNLGNLKSLMELDISQNRIGGVCFEGLEALTGLVHLNLSDNRYERLGGMGALKKLQSVNIAGNQIVELSGLNGLPALAVLDASRNKIHCLDTLPCLNAITEIKLDSNPLCDVSPLVMKTPKLELISAKLCRIRSVKELKALKALVALEDVAFYGNPCTLSQDFFVDMCRTLPNLETIDGILKDQVLKNPSVMNNCKQSTARPHTASRPNSANLTESDSMPVFHHPSERIGNQVQMLSSAEMQQKFEGYRQKLQATKATINSLQAISSSKSEKSSNLTNKISTGTDPLQSNAPSSIFSFGTSTPLSSLSDQIIKLDLEEPSMDIETQMKLELSKNVQGQENNAVEESPRLQRRGSVDRKRASTQGYRAFRVKGSAAKKTIFK